MSGSLLIKMCIEPTQVSVEDLIRREFGGSLILYYAEVSKSACQCIVLQTEFDCADELAAEFSRHEQACSLIERAIHDVAPGSLRYCSAIWLDDAQWFYPVQVTKEETAA